MNKKINEQMIIQLTDALDDAAMLYYNASIDEENDNTAVTNYDKEKGRLHYYECLMQVIDAFLGIKELKVDDETNQKINDIFENLLNEIEENHLNSEEVRRALLLLDVKGFKNVNFPLDFITPDNVALIMAKLVEGWFIKQKKLTMLDFNFGVGNLAFTIVNYLEHKIKLIGIDNHALLADVAVHKANMMHQDITMFHQDALEYITKEIDVVVSDIANCEYENQAFHSPLYDEGIRYFPYLAIEHYLKLEGSPKYVYLIDHDFFSQKGSERFKAVLEEQARIRAFIILPPEMFRDPNQAKALLLLDKHPTIDKHVPIYMLPPFREKEIFLDTMAEIIREINNQNH